MLLIIQLIYECTQALVRKKKLQHRTVLFKNGHEKMLTACKKYNDRYSKCVVRNETTCIT